jgi:hypothetical protein
VVLEHGTLRGIGVALGEGQDSIIYTRMYVQRTCRLAVMENHRRLAKLRAVASCS